MSRRKTLCYCDICGVSSLDKPVMFSSKHNKLLCGKHKWELDKFGQIKDSSQYNRFDKNRYRIENGIVYMDICNAHQSKVAEAIFDEMFLNVITQRKWRLTFKNGHHYVVTKAKENEGTAHIPMHRYIMIASGENITDCEVDHINGNTFDNRLCNLRKASRLDQTHNIAPKTTNKLGIRGVCYSKRDKYYKVDFINNYTRYYFKHFKTLPEAVYVRYLMEKHCFDDVAVKRHILSMQPYIDQLSEAQKRDLEGYVSDIIQKKEGMAS